VPKILDYLISLAVRHSVAPAACPLQNSMQAARPDAQRMSREVSTCVCPTLYSLPQPQEQHFHKYRLQTQNAELDKNSGIGKKLAWSYAAKNQDDRSHRWQNTDDSAISTGLNNTTNIGSTDSLIKCCRRRKMYCGYARLCVCLFVRGRTPTLLHGSGCNLGAW